MNSTPSRLTRTRARSQIEHDKALATPPGALLRVGTTPSPKTERILRTTRKPRCSDFGIARHYAFRGRGFFFCNPCDLWDALPPDASQKASINSLKFSCTASHTHFSHPTTQRQEDCYSRRRKRTVASLSSVVTARIAGAAPGIINNNNSSADDESTESNSSASSSHHLSNTRMMSASLSASMPIARNGSSFDDANTSQTVQLQAQIEHQGTSKTLKTAQNTDTLQQLLRKKNRSLIN